MLQGMQQSQAQAEGEKAGVDAELLRIQQLIRSFQDRIAQVWLFALHPPAVTAPQPRRLRRSPWLHLLVGSHGRPWLPSPPPTATRM